MLRNWTRAIGTATADLRRLRRMRPATLVLNRRWPAHGAHSGYLLGEQVGPELPRDDRLLPHPLKVWLQSMSGDEYWEQRRLMRLFMAAGRSRVLHLVDGDFDTWAYDRRPPRERFAITATFHQPVDVLRGIATGLRAGMLDGIVCVSRDQIPVLEHLAPPGTCRFIPHGVDTGFFTPGTADDPAAPPLVLSVGAHRRDFTTLAAAARIIRHRHPGARVLLVAPRDRLGALAGDDAVETLSGASDEQLRSLYRQARALLLPLEAATANNALLEGMAAGVPGVVTDLPAIRDYTDAEATLLCPQGDAVAHAEAVLALLADPARRAAMAHAARDRAGRFGWDGVRRQLTGFLDDVRALKQRPR